MKLTPVEFEIIEIIWRRGSALVKDVHQELSRRKGLAYTTVMTEMDHMYKKGILAHSKRGRAYLYTPRVTRKQVLDSTLDEFVSDFFHGSREELGCFISGDDQTVPARQDRGGARIRAKRPSPAVTAPTASEEEDVTLL